MKVTSLLHTFGAVRPPVGNPLHRRQGWLQDSSRSGGVLRGITQNPPLTHASGMAVARVAFLHLNSVRTGLVRTACYYILYWKASNTLYLDGFAEKATPSPETGRLARRHVMQRSHS